MDHLEMPQVLSGARVGRDDAGPEQVVASTVAAILIDRWRAERHVDDATLGIYGDEAPHVDAGPVLPAVGGPRIVVLFTRARNRTEGPDQLAGVNVPGPHVARGTLRWILLRASARD